MRPQENQEDPNRSGLASAGTPVALPQWREPEGGPGDTRSEAGTACGRDGGRPRHEEVRKEVEMEQECPIGWMQVVPQASPHTAPR